MTENWVRNGSSSSLKSKIVIKNFGFVLGSSNTFPLTLILMILYFCNDFIYDQNLLWLFDHESSNKYLLIMIRSICIPV